MRRLSRRERAGEAECRPHRVQETFFVEQWMQRVALRLLVCLLQLVLLTQLIRPSRCWQLVQLSFNSLASTTQRVSPLQLHWILNISYLASITPLPHSRMVKGVAVHVDGAVHIQVAVRIAVAVDEVYGANQLLMCPNSCHHHEY